jgi:hypothetical protein
VGTGFQTTPTLTSLPAEEALVYRLMLCEFGDRSDNSIILTPTEYVTSDPPPPVSPARPRGG